MSYRKWLIVAIVLFLAGLVLGLVTPARVANFVYQEIAEIQKLGQSLTPFSITTFIFIFARNTLALLGSFVLSPILIIAPVLSLVINGLVISFLSALVVQEKSILFVLAGILPHGILEIPAFIIGQAAALSFGSAAILALFRKEKKKQFWSSLNQNARYLLIAIVLLLPAAAIETYVTPLLIR